MNKLSQKDKSLILFFASVFVLIISVFSFSSYLFSKISDNHNDLEKIFTSNIENSKEEKWLNLSRKLSKEDLKNRIILLNFWSSSCVSCVKEIQEIKKIEKKFGSKITVISVHIAEFESEKDFSKLKKNIIKYQIDHPVINDANNRIKKNFNIKTLPTSILIDPKGNIFKSFASESISESLEEKIDKLVSKYSLNLNRSELPIMLEKNLIDANVLRFPTKIIYVSDFEYESQKFPVLIISNSGNNNIIVSSISGEILFEIGSKKAELRDGNFENASFNFPQGLLYKSQKLYVADTLNHAIREVNFKTSKVTTLIGSSQVGSALEDGNPLEASSFDLSSPTDIEFFIDQKTIAIANSGANQILLYQLDKDLISVFAGSGFEGMVDGKYPKNDLAQTSDLAVFDKKLYLTDAKSSSLRVIDESGNLTTLIGQGVKKSGNKNGSVNDALMQNPKGILVDDTGVFISDSLNNIVKKYDFAAKKITNFFGSGKAGDDLSNSSTTDFNNIDGIASALNYLYLADSFNNRIVKINRADKSAELVNIMPPLKLPKEGFLKYLPNLEQKEEVKISANSAAKIKIDLPNNIKINNSAPSFINLLELKNDSEANLIHFVDWRQINTKEFNLPKLKIDKDYLLQGVIYYCENKQNSLCFIKSYEQKISADKNSKIQQITIKVGY